MLNLADYKEITLELTDFCPHNCKFCSSSASSDNHTFLSVNDIKHYLQDYKFEHINVSGGEPLAHPEFYQILCLCNEHLTDNGVIVLYTNMVQAIAYNATILPGGVRVIANVPVLEDVDEVHVLKMIEQGRARTNGPRFHSSKNFTHCNGNGHTCRNPVILPTGNVALSPCHKDTDIKKK